MKRHDVALRASTLALTGFAVLDAAHGRPWLALVEWCVASLGFGSWARQVTR